MSEVSEKQKEILEHATAWPENYRNHFCTGEGSTDFEDCQILVDLGLMTRRRDHLDQMSESYVYHVTELGLSRLSTTHKAG